MLLYPIPQVYLKWNVPSAELLLAFSFALSTNPETTAVFIEMTLLHCWLAL